MSWKKVRLPFLFIIGLMVLLAFSRFMPKDNSRASGLPYIQSKNSADLSNSSTQNGKLVSQERRRIEPRILGSVVKTNDFRLKVDSQVNSSNQPFEVLDWDSIPDVNDGYLVQRTTDPTIPATDVGWTNPPTNYGKQVKILNVYPPGGNFLQAWMNQDNGSGQPVSMGLIEVTPVLLSDFNQNPNGYLKDSSGKYLYDGIYFGSEDDNGGWVAGVNDLTALSQSAVADFGETGRSVIFGHDTISYWNHQYFNTFANKLGLLLGSRLPPNYTTNSLDTVDLLVGSTKVQFEQDGFLNRYPYNMDPSFTYTIQASHTSGQYYTYNQGGTRWMKFQTPLTFGGKPDGRVFDTGLVYDDQHNLIGDNNYYLVTKNNYAMIQTGNITGACTPDEAKIIANMLYYTSTLNTTTHGEDHTVKDNAAPNMPWANVTTDSSKATINVGASDQGTDYFYRVKAKTASTTKYSDVVRSTVTSGVKGYIYQIDDNPNGVVTPVKNANGEVTNINLMPDGTGVATLNVTRNDGAGKYLHVLAVDNNNNYDLARTQTINLGNYLWWNVDSAGNLTIYPHELNLNVDYVLDQYGNKRWPWFDQVSKVKKAIIKPGVSARSSLKELFSSLYNMTIIEGLELIDTSNVTDMSKMFSYCRLLTQVDVSKLKTGKVTDMSYMFYQCNVLPVIDVSGFDTSQVTNMYEMFEYCGAVETLAVNSWNTSNVTNMRELFCYCGNLKNLDVTNFNTSKVLTMQSMFNGCSKLTSIDVTKFDTGQVTDMSGMFIDCSSLTNLDVTHFDTKNVTTMDSMFSDCSRLTSLDVTKFNTSKVHGMAGMFTSCSSLTSLDVTKFDTSQVGNMYNMFQNCSSLTSVDVTHFNTSKASNFQKMFDGCTNLKDLDVSHFDTSQSEGFIYMFRNCSSLKVLDVSHFVTSNAIQFVSMFENCSSLTSLDLSLFDTSRCINQGDFLKNTPALWKLTLGPKCNLVLKPVGTMMTDPTPGTEIEDLVNQSPVYYCTSPRWQLVDVAKGGDDHNALGDFKTAAQIYSDSGIVHTDTRTYVWDQSGKQTLTTTSYIEFGSHQSSEKIDYHSSAQNFSEYDNRNVRQGKTWKIEAAVSKKMQLDTDSTKIIGGNPLWFNDTGTGSQYNLTTIAQPVYTGTAGTGYQETNSIPWSLDFKAKPVDIPTHGHYTGQVTFTLVNTSGI